jgi:hypothetical protein
MEPLQIAIDASEHAFLERSVPEACERDALEKDHQPGSSPFTEKERTYCRVAHGASFG